MIFKPVLIAKILEGSKTVTRRPVDDPTRCRYEVGKVYGIQPGMARTSVARIRILSADRGPLGAIDDADAVLEGFADRAAFVEYWRNLYDDGFGAHYPVWRIAFEVVEILAWPCGGCDGHGYEPIDPSDRADYLPTAITEPERV